MPCEGAVRMSSDIRRLGSFRVVARPSARRVRPFRRSKSGGFDRRPGCITRPAGPRNGVTGPVPSEGVFAIASSTCICEDTLLDLTEE